jgi:glycosyltransferase involved in cell wall biosynthesis
VRIAAVFSGVDPQIGGAFTFANTILEAVRAAAKTSHHEFLLYVRGEVGGDPDLRRIPSGRAHRFQKGALRLLRAGQDYVGAPRLPLRTWFERSIENEGVEMVWFATPYAEECDVPFVFTLWDLAHLELPWFPEVSRRGGWQRRHDYYSRFLKRATAVTVSNEAGADELKWHFSIRDERILRIQYPTPSFALEAADRPASRAALDRHGIEPPYLFYPALFWAHKNHLVLLQAIAELRGRRQDYRAVCVGSDGGQLEHVRRLAEDLGVAEAVHILGFVETKELIALYKHAHALVHLSYLGPASLPTLEALALGCPVIASSVIGAREHLGDAALFVSPTDAQAVADAVERLNDQALRSDLVEKGKRRARQMTADDYVEEIIRFLDRFEAIRRTWG